MNESEKNIKSTYKVVPANQQGFIESYSTHLTSRTLHCLLLPISLFHFHAFSINSVSPFNPSYSPLQPFLLSLPSPFYSPLHPLPTLPSISQPILPLHVHHQIHFLSNIQYPPFKPTTVFKKQCNPFKGAHNTPLPTKELPAAPNPEASWRNPQRNPL